MEHLSEDRLDAYCLGRLDVAVCLDVEAHLVQCADCRRRVRETEELIRCLRAIYRTEDP